jgi:hypothetical protein
LSGERVKTAALKTRKRDDQAIEADRTSPEPGSARNTDQFHRFARRFRIGLTQNEERDLIIF